jgi:hypothetical protein
LYLFGNDYSLFFLTGMTSSLRLGKTGKLSLSVIRKREEMESRWRDSNPRPADYESAALPLSHSGTVSHTIGMKEYEYSPAVPGPLSGVSPDGGDIFLLFAGGRFYRPKFCFIVSKSLGEDGKEVLRMLRSDAHNCFGASLADTRDLVEKDKGELVVLVCDLNHVAIDRVE